MRFSVGGLDKFSNPIPGRRITMSLEFGEADFLWLISIDDRDMISFNEVVVELMSSGGRGYFLGVSKGSHDDYWGGSKLASSLSVAGSMKGLM